MKVVTIILLGCCLLGLAGLVFVGNRFSTDTAREIARLEGEINRLKRQVEGLAAGAGTGTTEAVQAVANFDVVSDARLMRAKETGRLYQGYFRIRSCPEGFLNVESDRIEGISIWCMKKE